MSSVWRKSSVTSDWAQPLRDYCTGLLMPGERKSVEPMAALRRDKDHMPVSAKELAMSLPEDAWKEVRWRAGSNDVLAWRFAALRVRPASRNLQRKCAPRS